MLKNTNNWLVLTNRFVKTDKNVKFGNFYLQNLLTNAVIGFKMNLIRDD